MGIKNHPIDTRCKRIIMRGGVPLRHWLAQDCPAEDREGLEALMKLLSETGAKEFWVGDLVDDDGVERLGSLIFPMLRTHNKDAKLVAAVKAAELAAGIGDPGGEIGHVFAHLRCRP